MEGSMWSSTGPFFGTFTAWTWTFSKARRWCFPVFQRRRNRENSPNGSKVMFWISRRNGWKDGRREAARIVRTCKTSIILPTVSWNRNVNPAQNLNGIFDDNGEKQISFCANTTKTGASFGWAGFLHAKKAIVKTRQSCRFFRLALLILEISLNFSRFASR